jgi:hypothetical protein
MTFVRRSLVLALVAALSGCAPAAPRTAAVPDAPQRLVFPGVSVLPPRGQGWMVAPREATRPPHLVIFGKRLRDAPPRTAAENHTIVAILMAYDVREFDQLRNVQIKTAPKSSGTSSPRCPAPC